MNKTSLALAPAVEGDLPICAGRGVYERVWPLPAVGPRSCPFDLGAGSLWRAGPYRPRGLPASSACPCVAWQPAGSVPLRPCPLAQARADQETCPLRWARSLREFDPFRPLGRDLPYCVGRGSSARNRPYRRGAETSPLLLWHGIFEACRLRSRPAYMACPLVAGLRAGTSVPFSDTSVPFSVS